MRNKNLLVYSYSYQKYTLVLNPKVPEDMAIIKKIKEIKDLHSLPISTIIKNLLKEAIK